MNEDTQITRDQVLSDALRYRRLRTLGCAPDTWDGLEEGLVLRFTNLDVFVDRDLSEIDRNDSPGLGPTMGTAPAQHHRDRQP